MFEQADIPVLQDIRRRAFAPVYKGFREAVGPDLAGHVFADAEQDQSDYLDSICKPDSSVHMRILMQEDAVIGFCGYRVNEKNRSGVIDLNAVDPDYQGRGAGKYMYEKVFDEMRDRGDVGVEVSTGGDAAHEPARRAYEGVGFDKSIPGISMYRLL